MQFYVDKHAMLHIILSVSWHMTATLVCILPYLLSAPLPTDAKYPISIDSNLIRMTLYVHQTFVGYQVSAGMALDCLPASLLWFCVVRFKLLAKDFQNIKNKTNFILCIRKHQDLIRYVKQLDNKYDKGLSHRISELKISYSDLFGISI